MSTFGIITAVLPIAWLLISLVKLRMPAYIASMSALLLSAFIAFFSFSMPVNLIGQASVEGFMLALFPILWVILSALFVYNTTVETGSMEQIKKMLTGISPDRRVQAMVLAFAFGGFLEAVAGFGTAVAIPAGIMIAMGFNPVMSATVCLIANTIPVAFGVLGVPIITLAQVTSLPLETLSKYTALQLIPFVIVLPFVITFVVTGSFKNIKGILPVSLFSGIAFAVGQTLTTIYIGPELAAVSGSLATMLLLVIWLKLSPVREPWLFKDDKAVPSSSSQSVSSREALRAWSPYILILLLIGITRFLPSLSFLNEYPFTMKGQFYFGEGGKPQVFQLATGSGTILFAAALMGGFIQGASVSKIFMILGKTLKQIDKTALTVLSIVAVAKIMGYSGMVNVIAVSLAAVSGGFYPVISPLIGALGTFITGSDTSSNVLFGNLQNQTAVQLGMNPEWLAASNASGATAGKMISPQSISIATASTGLGGSEGKILSITLKYCLVYTILIGVVVFIFQVH